MSAQNPFLREIAGALDWWREAGVDCDFADEPRRWLAAPQVEEPAAPAPGKMSQSKPVVAPLAQIGGESGTWPLDLEAFRAWWMEEASLDHGRTEGRVPPRGKVNADLLVLVEHPEAEDSETLLTGPDGKLLNAFLAAAGIAPENAYFASLLPRHTPHADWAMLHSTGLGEVLLHHIALAAPKRVLAFGGNILPLLGHDPAKSPDFSLTINQEEVSVPILAARELTALRTRPAWKAGLWRRWLDWTG